MNSTNSTEKCLQTLTQVEQELSSIIPIMKGQLTSNYQNISRALFPPRKQPSIYIKITMQFINETDAGKTVSSRQKFTWSESRHFVSVEFLSLTAMTLLSHGTIYPQRRSAELFITVHELCTEAGVKNNFENNDDMWKFVLLQVLTAQARGG